MGRRDEARALAQAHPGEPARQLLIYAGLNDVERAVEALQRTALANPWRALVWMGWPEIEPVIHSDPRPLRTHRVFRTMNSHARDNRSAHLRHPCGRLPWGLMLISADDGAKDQAARRGSSARWPSWIREPSRSLRATRTSRASPPQNLSPAAMVRSSTVSCGRTRSWVSALDLLINEWLKARR
jgi:hypothetical protein